MTPTEGISWIAFGLAMVSAHFLPRRPRLGVVLGVVTSVSFMTFGVMAELAAPVVTNVAFLAIHLNNLRRLYAS